MTTMMKQAVLGLLALVMSGCAEQTLTIEVTNPTDMAREKESIEVAWESGMPENAVVFNAAGEEIPSQVIYAGYDTPQALLFQADVAANASATYTIKAGERKAYPQQAFGRQVPERYDDYAWENNKVVYRLYGPALETSPEKLVTPGIDVWVKCTEKLVIDEWYAKKDYHHNYGEGMDCYKVGRTLGGGSSVPFVEGAPMMLPHNYATAETLENGPIRTMVRLVYPAFEIDGKQITLTKIISLDANSHFNRMESVYEGDFGLLPIASGFVRHTVKQVAAGPGWFAFQEEVSDSKEPERDGDIFAAILLPEAEIQPDVANHALAIKSVKPGESLVYWAGTGWSQGGIADMEAWEAKVAAQQAQIESPLQYTIQ